MSMRKAALVSMKSHVSSYILKAQRSRRHGVQKNGVHFGDTEGPEFNIADSSRLAEAWRLIAEVTAGRQLVFDVLLEPQVRHLADPHVGLRVLKDFKSTTERPHVCTDS